jgi:sugar lactone lactonase YvrE
MPLGDWMLAPANISWLGADLDRPECVLAERNGTLWCSALHGLTRIAPDGTQTKLGALSGAPNGFALERGRSAVIANIEDGKVYRILPDGRHETLLDAFEGRPLKAPNFVLRDGNRLWITISTVTEPRRQAVERGIADGFVLCLENGKARLAADGFCFTNEVRVDRARRHLYVAETGKGRVVRLPIRADGSLGKAETYGPETLFPGARIDGITFDAEGNLWVTEITRNGLFAIAPNGEHRCLFEDPDGKVIDFPASVCFAGPDLKTAYIGSIRMKRLASFRSPVAGEPLDHWLD